MHTMPRRWPEKDYDGERRTAIVQTTAVERERERLPLCKYCRHLNVMIMPMFKRCHIYMTAVHLFKCYWHCMHRILRSHKTLEVCQFKNSLKICLVTIIIEVLLNIVIYFSGLDPSSESCEKNCILPMT